ncbi:MAG: hypothetical protein JEY79_18550 [Pseudodesulfovibrio sp.]|nr:hypothetical protein [Pseudodesulfovibrio sp.]
MWIDKYASEALNHYEELRSSLTDEEIVRFRENCAKAGVSAMHQWFLKNWRLACEYLAATPSQRKKKKAWQDPESKPLLVWAACIYAKQGHALLQGLTNSGLLGCEGIGYRAMTSEAGNIYLAVLSPEVSDWPFPGQNPFESQ